jgi:predicted metal-dependent HD superfamily phosphohydrolase
MPNFRSYFSGLYKKCELVSKLPDAWSALELAYESPSRAHHNFCHAITCVLMGEVEQLPALAIMALLYHDAYYVAGDKTNEEKSVAILRSHFGDWSDDLDPGAVSPHPAGPGPLDQIAKLILATKHDREPATLLEAMVMDIDMAILGSKPARFAAYDEAIRAEFSAVSDADYEAGRVKFLQELLQRPQLFFTKSMQARYEHQARLNITFRIHWSYLEECAK